MGIGRILPGSGKGLETDGFFFALVCGSATLEVLLGAVCAGVFACGDLATLDGN